MSFFGGHRTIDNSLFQSIAHSTFRFPYHSVQTNAYPRNVQTCLDLYFSSMHGLSGFIVTMKMKTFKSFNNEIPDFDIQLVMQPHAVL